MHPEIELPGYEMLEQIGKGGMATVWTARQVSLDRIVAIKFLSKDVSRDADSLSRFREEAQSAARVKHPGIVQVFDAGEKDGVAYFIMEYIAGCTVGELLRAKKHLPQKQALLIVEGVALALEYAWNEARLVHCDIKPDNIMVDGDGTIKVADLGLAKRGGCSSQPSDTANISGTPNYMSPEQAAGLADLDCRTDIYALGATLYHMATGVLPFATLGEQEAVEAQQTGSLSDPMDVQPAVSVEMAWLIEKLMVRDREKRPADWKQVLGDIEDAMRGDPPRLPLPEKGASTVARGSKRAVPPARKIRRAKKLPRGFARGGAPTLSQKIILPKGMRTVSDQRSEAGDSPDLARSLLQLMALAVAVALAVTAILVFLRPPIEDPSDREPPPEAVSARPSEEPDAATAATLLGEEPPREAPEKRVQVSAPPLAGSPPPASEDVLNGAWSNPAYRKAALDFNEALEVYNQYLANRSNLSLLEKGEQLCASAAKTFEALRSSAPPSVQIGKQLDQCYKMIADFRKLALIAGGARAAAPAPAQVPAPSKALVAELRQTAGAAMALAPGWETATPTPADARSRDFRKLLSPYAQPGVRLQGDPSIVLYDKIAFLMPIRTAARILGRPLTPLRMLSGSLFPADSFSLYGISGSFADGFEQLVLVTDHAEQVIAAELTSSKSLKTLWLSASFFAPGWSVYDFIQGKTRLNPQWKIGHRISVLNKVIRIDTELAALDPAGLFGLGDSKARASLVLPESVAALMLQCADRALAPRPQP